MKKYERPEVEINEVCYFDVIAVSNGGDSNSIKDGIYESWGK